MSNNEVPLNNDSTSGIAKAGPGDEKLGGDESVEMVTLGPRALLVG
jgi:hypothetical protein